MGGYLPPSADELSKSVDNVKAKYKRKKRAHVVNFLEITQKTISETAWDSTGISKEELHDAALGLWTLCREGIPRASSWWDRYHFLEPDYSEGYLFNSGSTLYSILSDELKINKDSNLLDEKTKLKFLVKFYNLFFNSDASVQEKLQPWKDFLAKNNISIDQIKIHAEHLMKEIFNGMPGDISKLLHAIPTDKAIHQKMSHMSEDYELNKKKQRENQSRIFTIFNKENKTRKFSAQIAQAVSNDIPPDDTGDKLSRAARKRIGMLLYIMESINNHSWPFFSRQHSSELYKLCSEALNNEIKKFPEYTELECLTAFRNYIQEEGVHEALENYGQKVFGKNNYLNESIDIEIDRLLQELQEIIDKTAARHINKTNWPATKFLGSLGALILAAPFFGIGSLVGLTVSESNPMVRPKVSSGNVLNTLGTATMGLSHNYLCLMASSFIFQSGLMRAFGKLFEASGMVIGYGIFGTAGFLLDLSYKGFRNLCLYHIYMYEHHYDPELMKNIDVDFFKTCLLLPPNVIMAGDQEHLEKLAKENLQIETITHQRLLRP